MKKLFIAVPLVCALFFTSCEKEPEVITETVTETVIVKDTVTITEIDTVIQTVIEVKNKSVALYLEPIQQLFFSYSNEWSSLASVNFSATNLGDKKIDYLTVNFEARTEDGSTYTGSSAFMDIYPSATSSSQVYFSVDKKKCTSVKVKNVEITIY